MVDYVLNLFGGILLRSQVVVEVAEASEVLDIDLLFLFLR